MSDNSAESSEVRRMLNTSQVQSQDVPRWMQDRLREKFGPARKLRHGHSGPNLLMHAVEQSGGSCLDMDHYGTIPGTGGRRHFVSEPYGFTLKRHQFLEEFARSLGLQTRVDPASWHYPGETVRFVFLQPEDDAAGLEEAGAG